MQETYVTRTRTHVRRKAPPFLQDNFLGNNEDNNKTAKLECAHCIVDREQSGTLVARFTPDPVFVHLDEECSTIYETLLHFKVYKNQKQFHTIILYGNG